MGSELQAVYQRAYSCTRLSMSEEIFDFDRDHSLDPRLAMNEPHAHMTGVKTVNFCLDR